MPQTATTGTAATATTTSGTVTSGTAVSRSAAPHAAAGGGVLSGDGLSATLYDILEVIPTASLETIHAAYQSLLSRFHPDRMAGLGADLEAIARERTQEINYAFAVLGDAAARARYDEELLRADAPALPSPSPGAPRARRALAMLAAAVTGVALVLALPRATNLLMGEAAFSLTRQVGYFQGATPADARDAAGTGYLLVLWGWLFASYLFGLISYRLAVRAGQFATAQFGSVNDRLFLFLTFVCVVVTGELFFAAPTLGNTAAAALLVAGAYFAERGSAPDAGHGRP